MENTPKEEFQDETAKRGSYQSAHDRERRDLKPPKKLVDYVYMVFLAAEDGVPPKPKDYAEAMKDPHKKMWGMASDEEMILLKNSYTWVVVERPKDRKVTECRCIYKRDSRCRKFKVQGTTC